MTYEKKKEYLQRVFNLDNKIKSNIEELEHYKSIKDSLKAIDYSKERVQESGTASASYTRIIDKITDLELAVLEDIEYMLEVRAEVEKVILNLENQNEVIVCKYRHLLLKKWDDIADMMHMSERHVKRIHKSAILNISIKDVTKCH